MSAALVLYASTAVGVGLCGPRAEIVEVLKGRYDETRTAVGLASNGTLIEVYVSASGSWTLLNTLPSGESCVIAEGVGWYSFELETADTGA